MKHEAASEMRRRSGLLGFLGLSGVNKFVLAEVDYLPEEARQALPGEFAHLGELLRELLPKLGGAYAYVEAQFEDAGWVGNRWAEILPLAPAERLALLELADPLARLAQVASWSARQGAGARTPTRR